MDRNTILGIVLIVGIVITWTAFFGPEKEENKPSNPANIAQQDTTRSGSNTLQDTSGNSVANADLAWSRPSEMDDSTFNTLSDSMKEVVSMNAELNKKFGDFAPLAEGEDKVIHVLTDKLDFKLHTKGGIIRPLIMREFTTYDSVPLPLVTDAQTNMLGLDFSYLADDGIYRDISTNNLYLTANTELSEVNVTGDQTKEIVLRGEVARGRSIEFVYRLKGNSYDYGFEVRLNGFTEKIGGDELKLRWLGEIPKTEKAMDPQRSKTAVYYRSGGDVSDLGTAGTAPVIETFSETDPIDWVSFKSQFFSQTLMTEDEGKPWESVTLEQVVPIPPIADDPESGDVVKGMAMTATLYMDQGATTSLAYKVINSPLEYETLQGYERSMTRQIALGWGPLKYINMYLVIPVFDFLEGTVGNYGIIILILALLIKLLLYPLTFKTYISTAKMRVINKTPEIKELEEKYKDNSTKLQQEKMKIYRSMGANMLGGCLPMILQYPFLISLFFLFPNLIELRQQGFLWAEDLSTFDSVAQLPFNIPFYGDHVSLFTLLMTVSIYFYTLINQRMQGTTQTNPVMKWFPYIMPLIFLGFLNNYSAGLSWYYLVSNLISITQAQVSKLFINEEKLLEQMRENAKNKKNGKKGKGRLEKWADKQQQRQKQVAAQRQKGGGGGGGNSRRDRRGK